MANTKTLTSVFNQNKVKLTGALKGLYLPADANKIHKVVSDFLNEMFENSGEYRQSLTDSEDYILQASINLLQAQQNITSEIAKTSAATATVRTTEAKKETGTNPYYAVAGAGVGAVAGSILSTWGAVAGAIAGTAIVIYSATRKTSPSSEHSEKHLAAQMDANALANIVEKICRGIDGVMQTYRVQVKRVKDYYEYKEQPTLQTEYSELLEQITNVCNAVQSSSDNVSAKLKNATDALAESLENYGLKFENGKIVNA